MATARSSLLLTLACGLVALMASAGCGKLHRSAQASGPEHPEVASVLHLDSFLVNLQGGGYLRVGIDLGLSTAPKAGAETATPPIAPIRDTILNVLTASAAAPLLTPDGKEQLKKQLLAALRKSQPDLGLVAVYYTDFLVQPQ